MSPDDWTQLVFGSASGAQDARSKASKLWCRRKRRDKIKHGIRGQTLHVEVEIFAVSLSAVFHAKGRCVAKVGTLPGQPFAVLSSNAA